MQSETNLKELRKQTNKKQSEIAAVLGTTQSYYAKYENGKRPLPLDRATILARYYNVSLDYLAGLIDEPRPLYPAPTSAPGKSVSISNRGSNNKFNIKQ